MNKTEDPHKVFALLIGIDCYLPNLLPDGTFYLNLLGCVRDILTVEDFLLNRLGLPGERIFKLTASKSETKEPLEPREQWPTYENIVAAFKKITEIAQPGDQMYIHYSGHGGRATSIFPQLKGENRQDEVLVPTNIGDSAARYLRDVELAYLLDQMVSKGLYVTVVLDSCHAGGATRSMKQAVMSGAGEAVARGLGNIDTTPRPTASAVASVEELGKTWGRLSPATRSLKAGSGWLLEPQGYVLLAACRASEFAYEFAFNGKETSGALTHWLLDSLKQLAPGITYKMLHDRILPKVHSQFPAQTPQLQGEGDRVVFGGNVSQSLYGVSVMQVDMEKQAVQLNAGEAQGIEPGAQFVIYLLGETDFTRAENRLALVEVTEVGETDAWTKIIEQFRVEPIEQGCQAIFTDPGTIRLRRSVRFLKQDGVPEAINQEEALRKVENALGQHETGFVRIAAEDDKADFQVFVNEGGEYLIRDSAGIELPNLGSPLVVNNASASERLYERLIHLAKYKNVYDLDNSDPLAPLAWKLVVELAGKQASYARGQAPHPQPFSEPGNTCILDVGEWTFLRIKNNYPKPLNITVLNLQPDWGIKQVYPSGAGLFEHFDPGQEILIPLQAALPEGYRTGRDILKVFATTGACNFRWLELPPLDEPPRRGEVTRREPAAMLEQLLAAVAVNRPQTRTLNAAAFNSTEWFTLQVEIEVKQPEPT